MNIITINKEIKIARIIIGLLNIRDETITDTKYINIEKLFVDCLKPE
ncbi:hypothetical protein M5C72_09215 [Companilactobacillus allii]|nr:hypothetical protein [Companilactobacillus allii]USQ68056.1 hypothetical protein M5C72_09215 [Companilactobacillus allii]